MNRVVKLYLYYKIDVRVQYDFSKNLVCHHIVLNQLSLPGKLQTPIAVGC